MTDAQAKALMGDMLAIYKARTLEEIADRLEERAEGELRLARNARAKRLVGSNIAHEHAEHCLREEATKIRAQAKELRAA